MRIAIYGVGLLGSSIGYILKNKKWAKNVIGIGRDPKKLERAIELKAIDEYILEPNYKLDSIDILIVCTPVNLIPSKIKACIPYLRKGTIITDIGSTKKNIANEINSKLPDGIEYIGGHPMAGSEKVGVENLDPFIFENAVYVITSTSNNKRESIEKIIEMVKVLKANPLEMDAEDHDLAVATISHLPHIVASSLVRTACDVNDITNFVLPLAAGGFRDTTRVASGSPELWRDICLTNQEKILKALNVFKNKISEFENAIIQGDEGKLVSYFSEGKAVRDSLPKKRKGVISPMFEIVVFVPDVPGVIGEIAFLLGKGKVNIKDIEVLHIRENEGGSLRLGIEPDNNADRAISILKENGYTYKVLE